MKQIPSTINKYDVNVNISLKGCITLRLHFTEAYNLHSRIADQFPETRSKTPSSLPSCNEPSPATLFPPPPSPQGGGN